VEERRRQNSPATVERGPSANAGVRLNFTRLAETDVVQLSGWCYPLRGSSPETFRPGRPMEPSRPAVVREWPDGRTLRTDFLRPEHFGELWQLAGVQRLDMPFPRDERVVNQSVDCWTKMATGSESLTALPRAPVFERFSAGRTVPPASCFIWARGPAIRLQIRNAHSGPRKRLRKMSTDSLDSEDQKPAPIALMGSNARIGLTLFCPGRSHE